MIERNFIRWGSGKTGLIRCNSQWIESQSVQRIIYNTVFIIYLEYAKDFHLFLIFCTAWFLLVKNTRKILRKISYNRNPDKQFDSLITSTRS
jgi:hypothetical protein